VKEEKNTEKEGKGEIKKGGRGREKSITTQCKLVD